MSQQRKNSAGQSNERDFSNFDLRDGSEAGKGESRAKRERYLKELEKLKKAREEADRKETEELLGMPVEAMFERTDDSDSGDGRKEHSRKTARARGARREEKRKRNFLRNLITVISIFLVLWGVKFLFFEDALQIDPQVMHETGYYTVAVFGVDSRDGSVDKGALADVDMLVSLKQKTGEIRIASIYRDTFVQIDESGRHHKFNEAYMIGGPKQSLWTMQYNLDVNPDDYITFNWKAVIDAVNILGGVDIEITDPEFQYINAFITETVNSSGVGSVQLTHAGMNHLDGVQTVAYARLRLMDTDFNRTERQRRVVSLLMDKIHSADLAKRVELVTSVLPETKTSISIDDVLKYAQDIDKYHITETTGFPFDKETGWIERKDCVIPVTLETNVTKLHAFLFDDTSYRPSASVKSVSAYIEEKTGLSAEDVEEGGTK